MIPLSAINLYWILDMGLLLINERPKYTATDDTTDSGIIILSIPHHGKMAFFSIPFTLDLDLHNFVVG
ncbi:hypothetical protein Lac2_12750 [Claveliimonas bilis]|nr:hypothetical protein Lac2_12750 [Claveliimonas bilis]